MLFLQNDDFQLEKDSSLLFNESIFDNMVFPCSSEDIRCTLTFSCSTDDHIVGTYNLLFCILLKKEQDMIEMRESINSSKCIFISLIKDLENILNTCNVCVSKTVN